MEVKIHNNKNTINLPRLYTLLFNFFLFILTYVFSLNTVAQSNCVASIENGSTEICLNAGSTKTFSNSTASGGNIEWLSAGDGVFNNPSLVNPTYTPGPNDIANGYVFIYLDVYRDDSIAPCSSLPLVTIVLSSLRATINPPAQTICSGNPITQISLTGSLSGINYNWSRNNTASVTGMAASGSGNITGTLTNTTTAPATVTFTITPTGTTCPATPITATVRVNPRPNVVATPLSQTICSGATLTPVALSSAVNGTTYNWTRNNTASVTGIAASGSGNISGVLTNTTTAPVTVTFTITPTGNACPGTPITAAVIVNPRPASIISGDQAICAGTSTSNISIAFIGTAPWSFTYSDGTTPVAVTGNFTNPYVFTPPALPAIYTVTSLNDANCIAQASDRTGRATLTQLSYNITASGGTNGSISPNGTTPVNCGTSQVYTITPNSGYNVRDVLVDGVSQGAINSYTFTNVTSTHTISAVFVTGIGCIPPAISASVINVLCNNGSSGAINIITSGGTSPFTYSWTGPNGFIAATKDITGLRAGSYSTMVTAAGGCSAGITVNVAEPPAIQATATAGIIQCGSTSTTLTVTAVGGSGTKQFSLNGGVYQPGNIFTVNAAGSPYIVTVRDANQCVVTTNSVTVTQPATSNPPPKPTGFTGQVYGLCGGGTFTYTVQEVAGATGYTWAPPSGCTIAAGQGTSQIQLAVPSTFTGPGIVGVSASNDCGTGTKFKFTIYGVLYYSSSDISGPVSVTPGQTNVQYNLPFKAGLTYTWYVPSGARITNGQGSNIITVKFGTKSGKVSVEVKNTCGTGPRTSTLVTVAAPWPAPANQILTTGIYFSIYPNPAQNKATIIFSSLKPGTKFEVKVSNTVVESLLTKTGVTIAGKNMLQLDLSKFINGIYLVRLITEDNVQTLKLFKGQ